MYCFFMTKCDITLDFCNVLLPSPVNRWFTRCYCAVSADTQGTIIIRCRCVLSSCCWRGFTSLHSRDSQLHHVYRVYSCCSMRQSQGSWWGQLFAPACSLWWEQLWLHLLVEPPVFLSRPLDCSTYFFPQATAEVPTRDSKWLLPYY